MGDRSIAKSKLTWNTWNTLLKSAEGLEGTGGGALLLLLGAAVIAGLVLIMDDEEGDVDSPVSP